MPNDQLRSRDGAPPGILSLQPFDQGRRKLVFTKTLTWKQR